MSVYSKTALAITRRYDFHSDTYPILIVDMRTGLELLVYARGSIRLDVQVRRDEPVSRGGSVAIQGLDVEFHGSGVRKL